MIAELETVKSDCKDFDFNGCEKDLLIELCKKSPFVLGKYVLGYNKFSKTHAEWDDIVRSEIAPILGITPYRGLFLFPRETFKTTYWTITLSIWLLINNPDLTILICNEVQTNAKDMLREIKGHFESNDLFMSLFGEWYRESEWNKDSIIISKRKKNNKEPSIMAAGIGSTLTSKHFDVVICDDIAGTKDRDSEAGRNQTFLFFQDIWDVLKKESGLFIMPGTRWHPHDIYDHVIRTLAPKLERESMIPFNLHVRPAADNAEALSRGEVNYPDILPMNRLKELQTVKVGKDGIDITTFWAQYMLQPLDPSTQIFKTFHYFNIAETKFKCFVQWTDPALSDKAGACYSAIVLIGKIDGGEFDGRWGVAYASIEKRVPTKIIKDHNRIYTTFSKMYNVPIDVFMESNGFQTLLRGEAVLDAIKEGHEVPTVGRHNSENKDARIRSLEPYVSQAMVLFRDDWETAPEGYKILLDQLRNYPQAEKDAPDALQCAHKQGQYI